MPAVPLPGNVLISKVYVPFIVNPPVVSVPIEPEPAGLIKVPDAMFTAPVVLPVPANLAVEEFVTALVFVLEILIVPLELFVVAPV